MNTNNSNHGYIMSVLYCLDANMFNLVMGWLEIIDIGKLDCSMCEEPLRSEFLASLRIHEVAYCRRGIGSFFQWLMLRKVKIVELGLVNHYVEMHRNKLIEYLYDYSGISFGGLVKLELIGARLEDDMAMHIFEILKRFPLLSVLSVRNNYITHEGAAVLSRCLGDVSELTRLDVSYNDCIGDLGCEAISQGLVFIPKCECLILQDIGITALGASSLAATLPSVPRLKQFAVGYNKRLKDEGVGILYAGLRNPKLVALDIAECSLTDDGLSHVTAHVKQLTPFLQVLSVGGMANRFTVAGAHMLADTFTTLPHLQALHVCNCGLDDHRAVLEAASVAVYGVDEPVTLDFG